jgi:toxin secretion/phage lysis holin
MKETIIKWVTGGAISASSYLLGGWSTLTSTLILFMVLDYVTGLMASAVEGKLSSKTGYKGILKKLGIIIVLILCYRIDRLGLNDAVSGYLPFSEPALTVVSLFYIGMEGISILENTSRIGVPLPSWLRKAFETMTTDKEETKNDI